LILSTTAADTLPFNSLFCRSSLSFLGCIPLKSLPGFKSISIPVPQEPSAWFAEAHYQACWESFASEISHTRDIDADSGCGALAGGSPEFDRISILSQVFS
jgi:hypothetical protein